MNKPVMMKRDIGGDAAFPQPAVVDENRSEINIAAAYGHDPGLTIRQHVFINVCSAQIANGGDGALDVDQARKSTKEIVDALSEMAHGPG